MLRLTLLRHDEPVRSVRHRALSRYGRDVTSFAIELSVQRVRVPVAGSPSRTLFHPSIIPHSLQPPVKQRLHSIEIASKAYLEFSESAVKFDRHDMVPSLTVRRRMSPSEQIHKKYMRS
ncbi:hypothetical protein EVAR_52386_1 [Eumeta japonica]|uniref:Uncharacterized protein n=1 Tax=Eumeta variegata TaxID=151549 RepID=A0A4C1ZH46_EUMVA|nr:hypothetical protein EVAR_52386_1 [Eumeta japonica]